MMGIEWFVRHTYNGSVLLPGCQNATALSNTKTLKTVFLYNPEKQEMKARNSLHENFNYFYHPVAINSVNSYFGPARRLFGLYRPARLAIFRLGRQTPA